MIKLSTLLFIIIFVGCKPNTKPFSKEILVIRILPDTSINWQAKEEFDRFISRRKLSGKLGLPNIEKSIDSIEIRVWWQASIYSPSSVWMIHKRIDSLTAERIDYFPNYTADNGIDSMNTFAQSPIVNSWSEYYKSIDTSTFWRMPFHYELNGRYGCVDGESLTIEMFSGHKYKTVTYPCYMMYRDSAVYKDFTSLVTSITALKNSLKKIMPL